MSHTSRKSLAHAQDVSPTVQADVDAYKARAIWGQWRGLKPAIRARYFNGDEIAWLNRYGSRLDQLSSLVAEARNEREKHFVGVCLGHHDPDTDRERLWLRARMVVRFQASLGRAARCDEAERSRDELAARLATALDDLQSCQMDQFDVIRLKWDVEALQRSMEGQLRTLALRNVERVPSWVFDLHAPGQPLYPVIGGRAGSDARARGVE